MPANKWLIAGNPGSQKAIRKFCGVDNILLRHAAFTAIFDGWRGIIIEGKKYPIIMKGKLRAIETKTHIFIEQNPQKRSQWALLAIQGHKIMWVIRRGGKNSKNTFIGRVRNGQNEPLERRSA